MIYYFIACFVLILDEIIKITVPRKELFFIINYTQNTGAAFGIFKDQRIFLIIIGIAVISVVLYYLIKLPQNEFLLKTGLSFILGGSLGNILDRIFRGYVVDYIDLKVWPVFNLADICINFGLFLVVLKLLFLGDKKCQNSLKS